MTFLKNYQELVKYSEKYQTLLDLLNDQIHDFLIYYCDEHPHLNSDNLWSHDYVVSEDDNTIRIDWDYWDKPIHVVFPIECLDSIEKRDLFVAQIVNKVKEDARQSELKIQEEEELKERKLLADLQAKYGV